MIKYYIGTIFYILGQKIIYVSLRIIMTKCLFFSILAFNKTLQIDYEHEHITFVWS